MDERLRAIGKAAGKDDIAIEYERDGKQHSTTVALKEDERLGVYASTQVVRLDPSPRHVCHSPMLCRPRRA